MSALTNYYGNEDNRVKVLEKLWDYAKSVEPRAKEGLSYGLPALKLKGRPLIGFSMSKEHLSAYPFSPKVIQSMREELQGYEHGKGVIRFSAEKPITKKIVDLMIELREEQL